MKKSISIKLLAFVAFLLTAHLGYSQCAASFNYSVGANGVVTFSNTSTPSGTVGGSYWVFGNSTFSSVPNTTNVVSATYPVNGTYTIVMMYATGSCSTSTSQTINVNTVTTPTCNLIASFNSTSGSNGTIYFYNSSTGTISATTYTLEFGDGSSTTSFATNWLSHTYAANGTYIATLTANNNFSNCVSTYTAMVTVSNYCNLTPSITYSVYGNHYYFMAAGIGTVVPFGYTWNFGNGTVHYGTNSYPMDSTIYNANGIYTVSLVLGIQSCTYVVSTTVSVTGFTNTPCNLVANFNYTQGANGLANFNSTSTGTNSGTTYAWSFGDGGTGTGTNPSHTYGSNGVYSVTLTATNASSCTSTKVLNIYVSSYCNLLAGISYSLNANGNVTFQSTSTGTSSMTYYTWNFGDGTYGYTSSPSHNYANGTYWVMLTATNASSTPTCMDTAMVIITVTSNTCNANVTFSMVPSGTPHVWYAIPSTSAGIANATWNWGDGSSSNGLFSSHTYTAAGNYTVCLTVTMTCGATGNYCFVNYLYRSAEDNSIIQVNVVSANQVVTGIQSNSADNVAYSIYPNPGSGVFKLSMNGISTTKAKINIYNLVGESVYEASGEVTNGALIKDIQLDNAANGVYFIQVNTDSKTYTKKLVVTK